MSRPPTSFFSKKKKHKNVFFQRHVSSMKWMFPLLFLSYIYIDICSIKFFMFSIYVVSGVSLFVVVINKSLIQKIGMIRISTQSLRREQEENNFTIKRNYIWVQYWYRYIKTRVLPQQYDFDLWKDLNSFRNLQKKKTWNRLQGDSYKSDKSKKAFTINQVLFNHRYLR